MGRKPTSRTRVRAPEVARGDGDRVFERAAQLRAPDRDGAGDDSLPVASLLAPSAAARNGAASPPEDSATEPAPWRRIFAAGSPREVLARLVQGDPLGLRGVVAERLRERAWLADGERIFLRTAARCARFSVRYDGRPELSRWLRELVDEALLDSVREDLELSRAHEPGTAAAGPSELGAFADLARPLGLDPRAARQACADFNHLPDGERKAFFALVIEGSDLDAAARASAQSPTEYARAARRALDVLVAAAHARTGPASHEEPQS